MDKEQLGTHRVNELVDGLANAIRGYVGAVAYDLTTNNIYYEEERKLVIGNAFAQMKASIKELIGALK